MDEAPEKVKLDNARWHPNKIWRAITEPTAAIQGAENRRRARLLSSLLVFLVPIPVLVFIIRLIVDDAFTPSPVSIIGLLVAAVLYGFSRTRHYYPIAIATTAIFPAAIFSLVIINYNPMDVRSLLTYLGLGIIVGSILLSVNGVSLLAAINIIGIMLLPVIIPEVGFVDIISPLTFLILLSVLIIVAMRHRSKIESDRRAELEHSHADLQMEIEERVGIESALRESEFRYRQLNTQLEDRIQERTAQLEDANKELEAFSYSVSHDLKAPLRGIHGFSKALAEDYYDVLDESGKGYIDYILQGTLKMGKLIDDMLALSRITRHKMEIQTVDFSKLAKQVGLVLYSDQPQRQITFEIAPNMSVMGDETMLRILLENLFENAMKFTSKQEDAIIECGISECEGRKAYFIKDNGAGFNMDYVDKLFTPFQRLHSEHEYPGSGVGLSIVARIVSKHNGEVWAEGVEDQGASIFFTLGDR